MINQSTPSIRSKLLAPLLIITILIVSGCPLIAGTMDSVRRVGLTESSRQSLLGPAVTKFNEAIGWGDITSALAMVTEEYRTELRDELLRDKGKVKVIESTVDLAEFENDGYKATVYITMKAYTIPFYIAEPIKQKQIWEFSLSDSWKLSKRESLGKN